jgi:hypothetical protein
VTTAARGRWTSGWLLALPLYVALSTSLGFVDYRVRPYHDHAFTEYVPGVLSGTEEPPGKYRVLAPWVYEHVFARVQTDRASAWVTFRWISLLLIWIALHVYLTTWFQPQAAMTGAVIVAALLPLTFNNGWAHPDHLVELALLAACSAAMVRRVPWAVLAGLVALAALNRETSAIVVLLYALSEPMSRGRLVRVAGLAAVWLGVTAALRVALGWQPYDPWQLPQNLTYLVGRGNLLSLPYYGSFPWFFGLALAPMGLLAWRSWGRQPRHVRAAAAIVAPALVTVCIAFSSVVEPRVFSPGLVLLAPGVMFGLFEPKTG